MDVDALGLEILSRPQSLRLMRRRTIGRVLLDIDGYPAAFPVNFRMLGDDVVFRSGAGTKLSAASDGTVLGFQVDRIDPVLQSGWSVLLQGPASVITDPTELERARRLGLRPSAPGERPYFVRIRAERVSGRRFLPAAHELIRAFADRAG